MDSSSPGNIQSSFEPDLNGSPQRYEAAVLEQHENKPVSVEHKESLEAGGGGEE
ncbi:hypothetical protein JOQ06_028148, partial [Pogonophryne albipinna]